jgi:hypothetical protein
VCVWIDNQRSCDIVTIRVRRSIWSLRYQHGDVHQSINRYLLKVRDSTSHQVVSYFVIVFITSYPEKAKTFYTFCYHISFRAAIFVSGCFVEFVFIMVEYCCWFRFVFVVFKYFAPCFCFIGSPIPPPIHDINWFVSLVVLCQFRHHKYLIGCKLFVESFLTLDQPWRAIVVTNNNSSLYPISIST